MLLAELDPDEPFPVAELGTPRGRQGSPRARVVLPEGWLDDTDGSGCAPAEDADRGHRRVTGDTPRDSGASRIGDRARWALCFTRCVRCRFVTTGAARPSRHRPLSATAKDQRCGRSRHKRDTNARRKPRAALVAGPLALLATASPSTLGVARLRARQARRRHRRRARPTTGRRPARRLPAVARDRRRAPTLASRAASSSSRAVRRATCPRGRHASAPVKQRRHQALDDRRPQPVDLARREAPRRSASSRPARRSWSPAARPAGAPRSSSTARPAG